jgi:hypothetical protein
MKMWSGVSIMPYFLHSVTSIEFTSGVAFTIDPAFAAEVRAELGTMTCLLLGSLSLNLHRADRCSGQIIEKRFLKYPIKLYMCFGTHLLMQGWLYRGDPRHLRDSGWP